MKRTQRQLSEDVKAKISQAMKKFHRNRTEIDKRNSADKASKSMIAYWSTIPDGASLATDITTTRPTTDTNGQPIRKRIKKV